MASDVYEIVEQLMRRRKRWPMMAFYWFMALISMGHAFEIPSTRAWAVVRKSDGTTVTTVDDPMASEASVRDLLMADLDSLEQHDFDEAWGIYHQSL